jgi:hypothetical protein
MAEPFSMAKMAKSPFTLMYWVKVIMIGFGLAFLFGVGYCVDKALIHPRPTTSQKAETIVNNTYNYPERKGWVNLSFFRSWVDIRLGPQRDVNKEATK